MMSLIFNLLICAGVFAVVLSSQVDKRNHELGLWLLDSLPKATMKEVLQTVCREVRKKTRF